MALSYRYIEVVTVASSSSDVVSVRGCQSLSGACVPVSACGTSKGIISLVLHSAQIDSQDRQFITGLCISMESYFARTAWWSVVMTDRSQLPLLRLVWNQSSGQQCYCQKESPGDLFVLRYCPSSNSLCTKHDIFSSKK